MPLLQTIQEDDASVKWLPLCGLVGEAGWIPLDEICAFG